MKNESLTQERVRELLDYDPKTGIFIWKVNKSGRARAGDVAGCKNKRGYIQIKIDGKDYRANRLAWFYTYGYWSENQIDHENRIKDDNRLCNLREVSNQCNLRNTSNFSHNSSGVKGIGWHSRDKKWQAYIAVDGKLIHLGLFENFDDAVHARYEKEVELNWSGCDSTSPAYLYLKNLGII